MISTSSLPETRRWKRFRHFLKFLSRMEKSSAEGAGDDKWLPDLLVPTPGQGEGWELAAQPACPGERPQL